MRKMLNILPEKCTGCRSCELACSMKKTEEFNPARAAIRVGIFPDRTAYLPVTCLQCEEAWCARACPAGALVRDPGLGAIVVKREKCDGCALCVTACPFGVIRIDEGKAFKCDLCGGDPECVRFCAPGALECRKRDAASVAGQKKSVRRLKEAYRPARRQKTGVNR